MDNFETILKEYHLLYEWYNSIEKFKIKNTIKKQEKNSILKKTELISETQEKL